MYFTSMTIHQLNFSISCPVSHEIIRPQARQFWGEDLIQAVSAILYQVVHSFYRVFWDMRLGQKIKGLIGDPTDALHGFQWNK